MFDQCMTQHQAFSSGFSLWIIADLEHSKWAQKLDWYLNFQLRRASLHDRKKISESQLEKIASWGLDMSFAPKDTSDSSSPLLIDSHNLLPNRLTLQIPFRDLETWVKESLRALQNLKQDNVRIFLPSEVKSERFKELISESHCHFDIVDEASLV